jgi:hypothetical protein
MAGMASDAVSEPWDSEPWRVKRDHLLLEWFGGNASAVELMHALSQITELWDDLVDQDKTIPVDQINKAFLTALVTLPCNAFYREHTAYLTPLIIQAINSWQDANVLEHGDRNERALAYTLRNIDIQLVQAIVFITQGYEKMRELSPQIWIMFAAEQDDVLAWVGENA